MKFTIKNFGCRTNLAEAMEWADTLSNFGYVYTPNSSEADIIILNSCVLTKNAENEVRRWINKLKRQSQEQFVILTGCLTESLKFGSDFIVVDNLYKGEIPNIIVEKFGIFGEKRSAKIRARANVKIQEGCNFKCSFCIIPYLRGKARSVEEEEIIKKVKSLVERKFFEVVITGTHINSWGIDLSPKRDLLYLLKKLDGIEGLKRIRLTSLDPRFLKDSFIKGLKEISKLAHHFHISLQSGSNEVLIKMNRKGSAEEYNKILNLLREIFPDACIGADIIVGFPYEDEREFEKTFIFLKKSPVNYLHVFPFSPREGTPAFSMPQISEEVKKERVRILREFSNERRREFYRKFEGKKLPGIVIRKIGGKSEVLTHNYIKVIVESNEFEEGEEIYAPINMKNILAVRDFENFK